LVCRCYYFPHRLSVAKFFRTKRHLMREGLRTPFFTRKLGARPGRAGEAQFNIGDLIFNLCFTPVVRRAPETLMTTTGVAGDAIALVLVLIVSLSHSNGAVQEFLQKLSLASCFRTFVNPSRLSPSPIRADYLGQKCQVFFLSARYPINSASLRA